MSKLLKLISGASVGLASLVASVSNPPEETKNDYFHYDPEALEVIMYEAKESAVVYFPEIRDFDVYDPENNVKPFDNEIEEIRKYGIDICTGKAARPTLDDWTLGNFSKSKVLIFAEGSRKNPFDPENQDTGSFYETKMDCPYCQFQILEGTEAGDLGFGEMSSKMKKQYGERVGFAHLTLGSNTRNSQIYTHRAIVANGSIPHYGVAEKINESWKLLTPENMSLNELNTYVDSSEFRKIFEKN